VAIWLIPYTDMVLAVIRRTAKGMSPFDADREHLHHRLLNMGHSHRQSVLLMYLWAALFSGLVVGLSVLRISMIWFALITLAAFAALLLATAPKLRWWRAGNGKRARARGNRVRSADSLPVIPGLAAPARGPAAGALSAPVLPTANGSRAVNASPAVSASPAVNGGPSLNGGTPANGRPAVNGRPPVNGGTPASGRPAVNGMPAANGRPPQDPAPAPGTRPGGAPAPPWPGRR
jgi:UDP-GlcNAc:undecaprenyl-phosphate/decaprenyl-phosphate GlcNAc-1-phosphate transferase